MTIAERIKEAELQMSTHRVKMNEFANEIIQARNECLHENATPSAIPRVKAYCHECKSFATPKTGSPK